MSADEPDGSWAAQILGMRAERRRIDLHMAFNVCYVNNIGMWNAPSVGYEPMVSKHVIQTSLTRRSLTAVRIIDSISFSHIGLRAFLRIFRTIFYRMVSMRSCAAVDRLYVLLFVLSF